MKDNFSKRRFYLNKKEKTNFHNRNNAIEKNDNINIKNKILNTEINDEKELKTNLNNRSYFRRNYGKTEPEKLKVIENYILFENKNELKQKEKEEINPKRNYFNHFRTNKIVLNPNEYVNTTYKFNYNYNNNTNSNLKLKKGKFSKNSYNRSLENIKKKAQKAFESFNSEQNIDMIDDLKKNNEIKFNNISIFNININDSNQEKEKKNFGFRERRFKNNANLIYSLRNKKKEIIKIQSNWRGYYFRKKNMWNIKRTTILLVNNLTKILKKKCLKVIKILKDFSKKKYKYGKTNKINLTMNYNYYNRRHFSPNPVPNLKNNKNNNDIQQNTTNEKNNRFSKKNYSNLTERESEINNRTKNQSEAKTLLTNERINFHKYKEYNNINNEIDDDIFERPIKIIYVPKKVSNKNRYYYMKRVTKIKKIKLESFMKFIHKKFISIYFTIFKNKFKKDSLFQKTNTFLISINSIIKNYKKKYLKIYREKILDIKVKEELMKKQAMPFIQENKNNNLFRNKIIMVNNRIGKNSLIKFGKNKDKNLKVKFKEKNLVDDIIIEKINESENEEEEQNQKNNSKYRCKNKNNKLLNKIVIRKIENDFSLLNKYFKIWKYFIISFNDNNQPKIRLRQMHSPDMEIRGTKNKKRHIKIKYNRALTSKTSLSSIKSDGRSNSSSNFYIKKMKIRNIVINTFDNSIISYKTEDNYKKNTKLYNIIEKIETKANILKCFKCWKKSKRRIRSFANK